MGNQCTTSSTVDPIGTTIVVRRTAECAGECAEGCVVEFEVQCAVQLVVRFVVQCAVDLPVVRLETNLSPRVAHTDLTVDVAA